MVDFTISSQVTKILSRFDRKISPPPSIIKTLDFTEVPALDSPKKSSNPQNSSPAYEKLKTLFQDSFTKYFHPESPKSLTPERSFPALIPEHRSITPSSSSSHSLKSIPLFQPMLNKNSIKIASKLGNVKERLLTANTTQVIEEEKFSYKPRINKKSQKIVGNKGEKDYKWNCLYAHGKEKRIEREKIRLEMEIQERKNDSCTFRPNVLNPSSNTDYNKTTERLTNWAKGKNQKIKEKKDLEIDKDMKECTFTPKLAKLYQSKEELSSIKGINKFVQRGQRIKTDRSQEVSQVSLSPTKDMNQKKFSELQQALRAELFSLDL